MSVEKELSKLLPLGLRVTHFDGGEHSHGYGTIIAYNGIQPNRYLETNFKEAVELAHSVGLMGAVVNSMYDSERCPYVVRFDSTAAHPRGYKDVYETNSLRVAKPEANIFPDNETQIMARHWWEHSRIWSEWYALNPEQYKNVANNPDYEFCIRPAVVSVTPDDGEPWLLPQNTDAVSKVIPPHLAEDMMKTQPLIGE